MTKNISLVFDTEADFYYSIPSPHFSKFGMLKWKLNKLIGKIYRYPYPSRNGLINIVGFFKKHSIPASFCISGHLYLKNPISEEEAKKLVPENPWFHKKIGKNWYYWLKDAKKASSSFCLGNFIEKEMKTPLFDLGFHGFAHEALTLESKDKLDRILAACQKSAKKLGINANVFAAPFNMIEELSDSDKVFSILKKHGIKYVQYAGKDNGLQSLHSLKTLNTVENRNGLKLIRGDGYFEATSSEENMEKLFNDILESKNKNFLIVSHDFTWKNLSNLKNLVKFCKKNKIGFIKMSQF